MQLDRIAELLEPFVGLANEGAADDQRLTTSDLLHISTYIDILLRWNTRINLTAIRDPEEIVARHFGESLFAARHLFPRKTCVGPDLRPSQTERSSTTDRSKSVSTENGFNEPREGHGFSRAETVSKRAEALASEAEGPGKQPRKIAVADVGSGAGFPGIPIKLWRPDISLTLIESNHKKATFLREVARALTLTEIDIKIIRAETLPGAAFDLVTLRAVERFETILPVAAHLVGPGGRLALLVGSSQLPEVKSVLPQFIWSKPTPIPMSNSRILLVGQSQSPME